MKSVNDCVFIAEALSPEDRDAPGGPRMIVRFLVGVVFGALALILLLAAFGPARAGSTC